MSHWSRLVNIFRRDRVLADIDEELRAHLEEAAQHGRDNADLHRRFGSTLRLREQSADVRFISWLDSVRADIIFAVRQIRKSPTVSAAAVLSLGLAMGACTSAFRIIDALLLRPLPVRDPSGLYVLTYPFRDGTGNSISAEWFDYPQFRFLRSNTTDVADLIAISMPQPHDLQLTRGGHGERFFMQYVSGWMFQNFGLEPAAGRLLTAADDRVAGSDAVAVLSYDYWTRRFARDPAVIGRKYFYSTDVYQIVGVAPRGFTGTDPGAVADVFVPTMMNSKAIDNPHWGWFRIWVRPRPGVSIETAQHKLQAALHAWRLQEAKQLPPPADAAEAAAQRDYLNPKGSLEPAAAGFSGLQNDYRRALFALAALVVALLLIACANMANLMTARAAARAREMALRVSIGAGRARLMSLVMTESLLIGLAACALGVVFAWWSAPLIISAISPPDDPIRLILPADVRFVSFCMAMTFGVTLLFGLMPALRASAVRPMNTLRGEKLTSRRRVMNLLIGGQAALCFLVQILAGLFVASFMHLSHQPTGFIADGVLAVETATQYNRPSDHWLHAVEQLRSIPGITAAAVCGWAPMSGNVATSGVRVNGSRRGNEEPYILAVSPGWFDTMRIPLLAGRDFRVRDAIVHPAVVNTAFARRYFNGDDPVGRAFQSDDDKPISYTVVGYVADSRYADLREPLRPTIFTDFEQDAINKDWATFMVRTQGRSAGTIAPFLRGAIRRAGKEFGVVSVIPESEIVGQHIIRERLLAGLAIFFSTFSLALSGIGLYGVLSYSVLQQRRDLSIRIALGARVKEVVLRVVGDVSVMLTLGSAVGIIGGLFAQRYVSALLFQVSAADPTVLSGVGVVLVSVSLVALAPAVRRALRIDPAAILRAD